MSTLRNVAGYLDPTASKAINRVDRERKRERMKKNCKGTRGGKGWQREKNI